MGAPAPVALGRIDTDDDLARAWTTALSHSSIRTRSLWAMFLGPSGRVVSPLEVVGGLSKEVDSALTDDFVAICRQAVDRLPEGSSVAIAIARPGAARLGKRDRQWVDAIARASYRWGQVRWPVHLYLSGRLIAHDHRR